MNCSVAIHRDGLLTTYHTTAGINLHEALRNAGYAVVSPCGGAGWCGKCIVKAAGALSEPTESELKKLIGKEGCRLACQTTILGDCEVWLDESKDARIQTEGTVTLKLDPRVKVYKLTVMKDTLSLQKSDEARFKDAYFASSGRHCTLPLSAMQALYALRDMQDMCAVVCDDRVLTVLPGDEVPKIYGAAVDIGTTTVVAYLYDLLTGTRLAVKSGMNAQKTYGDDVISRISYGDTEENGVLNLATAIRSQLNDLIAQLCSAASCKAEDIYHMTVAGNTVMEHLFAGLDPSAIARAPFTPVSLMGLDADASEFGICIHPNAVLSLLPCIAGYVGGDITAGIYASDLASKDELSLFVDIGTNGEMALGNKEKLLACAVAAGPAFEGGRITYGMNGVEGAVSKAEVRDNALSISVIGDAKAIGICGSGLVDLAAAALEIGAIDETGRMVEEDEAEGLAAELLSEDNDGMCMKVADGVYLTESDIRQLQLAKSAVMAGIEVLADTYGVSMQDVKKLYLAGGFGNYIDRSSAAKIGLLPDVLAQTAESLGNAAGMGAIKALLDKNAASEMSEILAKTQYIELSGNAAFNDAYIDHMMFE